MIYGFLADALTLFHFLWILFNITGFFWALKWPILGKIHAGTLGVSLSYFIVLKGCPATEVEWWLRQKENPAVVRGGSFIRNYIEKLIYIEIPNIEIWVGRLTVVLFVLSIYLHIVRPWWKSRRNVR